MAEKRIVIVGAGVAGLTTALLLSRNPSYKITVAAKHMPGDYDIEYASPWAGANYMPVSARDSPASQWDRNTWPALENLARNHPEAGVHFQTCRVLNRRKDVGSATATWLADLFSTNPWWKDVVPDFREIPKAELPEGVDSATSFTSVCINTAIYLPFLVSECLKAGVNFKRAIFHHICDAVTAHISGRPAQVVVNCTGLSAARIKGVEDETVIPARGQVVLVSNDPGAMYTISGVDHEEDEVSYIMMRAAGGGTVLGGSYQKGNWESQPDPNLAMRIMTRAVKLCPQLTSGAGVEGLHIIRHGVGLRPLRAAGARVEKEKINGVWVIHNYGHGGYGYQSSYGCSDEVVKLVHEIPDEKARL